MGGKPEYVYVRARKPSHYDEMASEELAAITVEFAHTGFEDELVDDDSVDITDAVRELVEAARFADEALSAFAHPDRKGTAQRQIREALAKLREQGGDDA